VLVDGQVLSGMNPTDTPLAGKSTMPLCWIRSYTGETGKTSRVFTTTIGAALDFQSEGLRRLFVNACLWGLGMEASIPAKADVSYLTPYAPSKFKVGAYVKGVKPADLAWSPPTTSLRISPGALGTKDAHTLPAFRPDGRRLAHAAEGGFAPFWYGQPHSAPATFAPSADPSPSRTRTGESR
jgi:hypothetical protein